jgi:hypothetical protein
MIQGVLSNIPLHRKVHLSLTSKCVATVRLEIDKIQGTNKGIGRENDGEENKKIVSTPQYIPQQGYTPASRQITAERFSQRRPVWNWLLTPLCFENLELYIRLVWDREVRASQLILLCCVATSKHGYINNRLQRSAETLYKLFSKTLRNSTSERILL